MVKKNRKAYSLLELSIVITIISILITGAMTTAVSNINSANVRNTKAKLDALYKAFGSYTSINKKLPCPADLTDREGEANYGAAVGTDGTCSGTGVFTSIENPNLVYGMVPVKALGLANDMAKDSFGSKIVYIIDKNFTAAANFSAYPNFAEDNFSIKMLENDTNNIQIDEKLGTTTRTAYTNAMIVLISYGPNKYGAYGANSTTRNANSPDSDEITNGLDGSDEFNYYLISKSVSSDIFDDIMLYTNTRVFLSDFDLYRLLPCTNSGDEANYPNSPLNSKNAWFGQEVYGNNCPSPDYKKYHSKKCGPVGVWVVMTSCTMPN